MRGAKEKRRKNGHVYFWECEALHYIYGRDGRKAKEVLLVVKSVRYCEKTPTNSIQKKKRKEKTLLETRRSDAI